MDRMICWLEAAFLKAWSRETSAYPDKWTPENPACGQCFSTAMVAQDYLGGEIEWGIVSGDKEAHFWNRLPGSEFKDFTASQLPSDFVYPKGRTEARESLEAFVEVCPDVGRRYQLLSERVEKLIMNSLN
jgi:hypothetical protein